MEWDETNGNQLYSLRPVCLLQISITTASPEFCKLVLSWNIIYIEIQTFINSGKGNVMILEYLIVMPQYFWEANDTECEAL